MPRFAFYGDDFTGSVDALLQFRRAGLSGVLLTSRHAVSAARYADVAVVGLAGVARSLATEELVDEVGPALRELRATGAQVVQYKACSTGDSSARIGSLGRVLELGRQVFGSDPVPVVLAQPDFGRYTFFGHHFAADGERVYRLDRQPTMRAHPTTPATESDLTEHLAAQTQLRIDLLPWTSYTSPAAVATALHGTTPVVVADAFTDDHLQVLATAILDSPDRPRFVIGSGGISKALGAVGEPTTERLPTLPAVAEPATAPVLVLCGSTSERTRQQISSSGWPVVDLFSSDAAEVSADHLDAGRDVVVSSTAGSVPTAEQQGRCRHDVAPRLAEIGRRMLHRPDAPGRMIICGGDTAGGVLGLLGVESISIVAQPWGNAVLCRAAATDEPAVDGLEIVLKGGQMGHPQLFNDVRAGIAISTQ